MTTVADAIAAMKWFRSLSTHQIMQLRKKIPHDVSKITEYWIKNIKDKS